MAQTTKPKKKPDIDEQAAVQALEYLLAAGYVSKKRLYLENFMRGIFFSAGSVLGAAVIVTLILWLISLFNDVPFIGDIVENVQRNVRNR